MNYLSSFILSPTPSRSGYCPADHSPREESDVVERQRREDEEKIVDREHVAVFGVERRLDAEIVGGDGEQRGERAKLSLTREDEEACEDERKVERRDEEFLQGAHDEARRARRAFGDGQGRSEWRPLKPEHRGGAARRDGREPERVCGDDGECARSACAVALDAVGAEE